MGMPWPLAGPLLVDRAAERRESVDLDAAHGVIVSDGLLLTDDAGVALVPPGQHPEAEIKIFLGQHEGTDIVAIVPESGATLQSFGSEPDGGVAGGDLASGTSRLVALREVLADLPPTDRGERDREIASTAVALATWHANHPRCAVCGDVTEPRKGGWVRYCARDEREHYPRTDPAVIVAITDPDDRLLLAHAGYWSARRFSHLAGYVEPGESLEQAVHREVLEEARLEVLDLHYEGSQPWPFPASVMVGFTARVASPELTVDGVEITEARFFTRDEVAALSTEGTIVLAPRGSIARRLIEQWYGGQLS